MLTFSKISVTIAYYLSIVVAGCTSSMIGLDLYSNRYHWDKGPVILDDSAKVGAIINWIEDSLELEGGVRKRKFWLLQTICQNLN